MNDEGRIADIWRTIKRKYERNAALELRLFVIRHLDFPRHSSLGLRHRFHSP